MTAFRRGNRWVSKFQLDGKQRWTPGGPWETKTQALNAERHHRDRLRARRSDGANIELHVWGTGTPPVALATTTKLLGRPEGQE